MGLFVLLPLVLPLSALPIARLAEQHLHPRGTTRLLTCIGVVLALCSTLCLGLLMVVGTAQLPGNPLPDGWSDPEVRAAVPFAETTGTAAIGALALVLGSCGTALWRHRRVRARALEALDGLPYRSDLAVLPDSRAYAYALPGPLSFTSPSRFDASHFVSPLVSPFTSRFSGSLLSGPGPYGSGLNPGWPRAEVPGRGRAGRVVVSTGMLRSLAGDERRALIAHERAHLGARHHRFLLASQLAARANPLLRPLRDAVAYSAERWADEEAARAVGDRKVVARAVGKAALVSRGEAMAGVLAFASTGPVPRRVAALLEPTPPSRSWPPALTRAGLAAFVAAAGTAASALSSLNAAVALFLVLKAATPL